jgi:endonuclease YncB( thermonuclease family)
MWNVFFYKNIWCTDSLINSWLNKHPNAMVKTVVSQVGGSHGISVTYFYCWVVAGKDTLNNALVKNGCFSTTSQFDLANSYHVQPLGDSSQYIVYVDTLTFNKFTTQIKNAETFAKRNKLGIWHE